MKSFSSRVFAVFVGILALVATLPGRAQDANELQFEIPVPNGVGTRYDRVTNSIRVENGIWVSMVVVSREQSSPWPDGFHPGDIYYTLDGTEPSFTSARSSVAQITNTTTLRAVAYSRDYSTSVRGQLFVEVIPTVYLSLDERMTNLITVSPSDTKFAPGTLVTFNAADRDGWVFDHWTNALSSFGTNRTASLVMDADKAISARFVTRVNPVVSTGGGRIQVSPERVGFGESVTVTAVPDPSYYFLAWGTPPGGSENPATVSITTGTQVVAAAFAPLTPDQVTLKVTWNLPFAFEAVVVTPKKNVYFKGETVSVFPFRGGSRFTGWSGDASGFDSPLTLVLDSNKTIQANFEGVTMQSVGVAPSFTPQLHAPAIAEDGTVYVAQPTTLHSLKRNLETNWVLTTDLLYHSIPAIGESGTVYVAGADGDAVAVRPDGTILWTFRSGNPHPFYAQAPEQTLRPHPPALSADETLYIAPLGSTNVYVVKDGALLRTIGPAPGAPDVQRRPIIGADGTLYMAAAGGFSAHTPDGAEKWQAPFPKPSAIDANGRLYSVTGTNVIALDFEGNHLWTASVSAPVQEVLLGESGRIFARSEHGLTALQTNGTLLWTNGTSGRFVPLADGGVLVTQGGGSLASRGYKFYQNITADGKNGPFFALYFLGFHREVSEGIPVVSKLGDIYAGWSSYPYNSWMDHVGDDIPLARSSWPLPWGFNNTGRAVAAPAGSKLSIQRKGAGLMLRGSGFAAPATLESSPDLEHWTVVEQFSSGFAKDIPAEGRRYYRLRAD